MEESVSRRNRLGIADIRGCPAAATHRPGALLCYFVMRPRNAMRCRLEANIGSGFDNTHNLGFVNELLDVVFAKVSISSIV